ncbi:hypothetical protein LTR62_007819 [Meristemomyces frigidus]|uniref:Uncharacterized protein n=1 Tax=Meristemomyces frigidus TaxID=1508187 RepID=A0AAN7YM47_9PEZI|nr:hypothetical protein LTR62_007819 [Meristemomyces frigidus]
MFHNKARPAPSKDALKVLYQLAYISSGTAVGVAGLCAEERRRRTTVVQKIAENARRIRQSPRYYHSSVAAEVEGGGGEDVVGLGGGFEWVMQYGAVKEKRSRRVDGGVKRSDELAARGEELPSVVEKGYAQLNPVVREGADGRVTHLRQGAAAASPAPARIRRRQELSLGSQDGTFRPQREDRKEKSVREWGERRHDIKRLAIARHDSNHNQERARTTEAVAQASHERTHASVYDLEAEARRLKATTMQKGDAIPVATRETIRRCFQGCIEADSLPLTRRVLIASKALLDPREYAQECDNFLELCDANKSYQLVCELFRRSRSSAMSLSKLSDASIEIVAAAYAETNKQIGDVAYFVPLYRRLPAHLRVRLTKKWTRLSLMALWRSTRDLPRVMKRVHEVRTTAAEANDTDAMRLLDLTLLDILLSANSHEQALDLLTRMHAEAPDDTVAVTAAAVSFARKSEWSSVDKALDIAKTSASFSIDADAARRLNNVIHLYAKVHDAIQTWKFVTALVDDLAFRPNQATTMIMLQTFISNGCIWLIPKWLRYSRVLGVRIVMDSQAVAKLLGRFYVEFRPSHVLMLWFGRNLVHRAPALAGAEVMDPIREAVAWDLRNCSGQNKVRIRESIGKSLRAIGDHGVAGGSAGMEGGVLHEMDGSLVDTVGEKQDVLDTWGVELSSMVQQEAETVVKARDGHDELQATQVREAAADDNGTPEMLFTDEMNNDNERDMLLALSLGNYKRVISLYKSLLDADGLPGSPFILEVAVQACLKLENGDTGLASELLQAAKEKGMNISCAIGPMLINQIKQLSNSGTWQRLNHLRRDVIEYYQVNDNNGWPIKHHVCIAAADLLLKEGLPQQALDVLQSILQSQWAVKHPPNISLMTCALRAYVALRSELGVRAVFRSVLGGQKKVHIDLRFINTARQILRKLRQQAGYRGDANSTSVLRAVLTDSIRLCHECRRVQRFEAKKVGVKLVACLVRVANEAARPPVPLDQRAEIEAALFGGTPADSSAPSQRFRDRAQTYKLAIARSLRADRNVLGKRRRLPVAVGTRGGGRLRWTRRYRAFLRHELVVREDGGRVASFRYRASGL